jgi:branched-chain amino acid transport system permease protein
MILPLFISPFSLGIVSKAFSLAIFAMSLDLLIGYTGLFSLGHAAFFGAGSYSVAMLFLHAGISSFWVTAPVAIVIATVLAALFGLIVVRFTGIYFLLLTFAFGELLFSFVWKFKWFQTPGIEAVVGLPRPDLSIGGFTWNDVSFYYFVFLFLVISYLALRQIVNSFFGHTLRGIHENEPRMRALGYNTWLYKYVSFVIAGFFGGVGGVFFIYSMRFAVPDLFGIQYSFLSILMVILGGAGTIFGPAIGAFLMVIVELVISLVAPDRWPLIFGAILVVAIMLFRGGFAPHLGKMWAKGPLGIWKR